jgi:hypothetical protein
MHDQQACCGTKLHKMHIMHENLKLGSARPAQAAGPAGTDGVARPNHDGAARRRAAAASRPGLDARASSHGHRDGPSLPRPVSPAPVFRPVAPLPSRAAAGPRRASAGPLSRRPRRASSQLSGSGSGLPVTVTGGAPGRARLSLVPGRVTASESPCHWQ